MTPALDGHAATPAQPAAFGERLRLALADIKLAHSVFALPFAVLGAFLARDAGSSWRRFGAQLALIVVCMVLARTWAMLVNRLADRRFDADNPRTARRALASGRLRTRDATAFALASAAGFIAAAGAFWPLFGNVWPLVFSAPVLGWIALYSFTKRFTWLCHVFLGGALAASPLAAAIAIDGFGAWTDAPAGLIPGIGAPGAAALLLAGMVVFWVAGFDVIYALQDVNFDRERGLFSIPARLGPGRAIVVSRLMHALAAACLACAGLADPRLGITFGAAVVLVISLLIAEHAVLARQGERGLDMAFFTLNGVVSVVLGVLGVVDLTVV